MGGTSKSSAGGDEQDTDDFDSVSTTAKGAVESRYGQDAMESAGGGASASASLPRGARPAPAPTRCLLAMPDDHRFLSASFCLVRRHVEAFVVLPSSEHVGKYDAGRVGVRCAHCHRADEERSRTGQKKRTVLRARGSTFYPKSIRLVYQAVRNVQRYHLMVCPDIPRDVKDRFEALKQNDSSVKMRSNPDAPRYWEDCCRGMGMVDAPEGKGGGEIRLRSAGGLGFLVDDDNSGVVAEPEPLAPAPSLGKDDARQGRSMSASAPAASLLDLYSARSPTPIASAAGASPELLEPSCGKRGSEARRKVISNGVIAEGRLLHHSKDPIYLNALFCFVRKHVEAFVIVDPSDNGKKVVGIRCPHCAAERKSKRTAGEVSYPSAVRLVYQSVRNFQRYHLQECPHMPQQAKEEYATLKARRSRSGWQAPQYWEECCRRMGMIDVHESDGGHGESGEAHGGGGITLRGENFEDIDDKPFIFVKNKMPQVRHSKAVVPSSAVSAVTAVAPPLNGAADNLGEGYNTTSFWDCNESSQLPEAAAMEGKQQVRANDDSEGKPSLPVVVRSQDASSSLSPSLSTLLPIDHHLSPLIDDELFDEGSESAMKSSREALDEAALVDLCALHCEGAPPDRSWTSQSSLDRPVHIDVFDEGKDFNVRSRDNKDRVDDGIVLASSSCQVVPSVEAFASATEGWVEEEAGLIDPCSSHPKEERESFIDMGIFDEDHGNDGRGRGGKGDSVGGHSDDALALFGGQAVPSDSASSKRDKLPTLGDPHLFSDEEVLDSVKLALSLTEAARRQDLFLSQQSDDDDLRLLGTELYKLFSGVSPSNESTSGDSDFGGDNMGEDEYGKREKKRRGHTAAEVECYTPLSDMGFPPVICSIVSSLLDRRTGIDDGGAGNGNDDQRRGRCTTYETVGDVEEDLRLIASQPEKFLSSRTAPSWQLEVNPRVIYGCHEETSQLREAFDRITTDMPAGDGDATRLSTKEVVLVTGYSGAGKSSLVRNVRDFFTDAGACFLSGKFDAMRQLHPLSAVVSAMDDYCVYLAEDADRVEHVRTAIELAIHGEGRVVLSSFLPNFERIVGPLPQNDDGSARIPKARGGEALQQLVFVIRLLFRATCSRKHPVVLFLDDLQWSDDVSLMLIRALATDAVISGLLFVGSYRDADVGPDHPLTAHLEGILSSGSARVTSICVGNLNLRSVNSLVSDALHLTPRMTLPLAEAVLHKTGGNALFVVQFLASLRDEGILHYSLSSRRFEWDITKVREKDIADGVAELLTLKLQRMAPEVLDALMTTAALGAQCQEDMLDILDRAPGRVGRTATALDVAVAEGIMSKVGSTYRFAHDQVQQATYLLIRVSDRAAFHLLIGQLLKKWCTDEELETHLFTTVDQLHHGSSLIQDQNERVDLVRLSLIAGQKAVAMSAFLPASSYLKAGICLLNDCDWIYNRAMCFDLYSTCAETECTLGDLDGTKMHVDEVLKRANTLQEKLRPCYTLVQYLSMQGHTTDAINSAMEVLSSLGENFPSTVTNQTTDQYFMTTQELLASKTEEELLQLGTMVDADKKEVMKLINLIMVYIYATKQEFFSMLSCRMVQLSLSHGVSRHSAMGFACYGLILCGQVGDYAGGYRFGKVALSILDRFDAKESLARVYTAVYGFITNWKEPLQACLPCHKLAIDTGLQCGDTDSAMLNAHLYCGTALAAGRPLGPLMDEMTAYSKQMVEYKQYFLDVANKPARQATLNLLGKSYNPMDLIGDELDESTLMNQFEDDTQSSFHASVLTFRLWLFYLFGEYRKATESAEENQCVEEAKIGRFAMVCNYFFFSGLAALAMARKEGRDKYLPTIIPAMAKMKAWASCVPWNCQHKLELMEAEYAYLGGKTTLAAEMYDRAQSSAAKHHFVHEEALVLERAGIFYLECGDQSTASGLFVKAQTCYTRWGALSKVAHIQEKYL